jgi:hypothetical protein
MIWARVVCGGLALGYLVKPSHYAFALPATPPVFRLSISVAIPAFTSISALEESTSYRLCSSSSRNERRTEVEATTKLLRLTNMPIPNQMSSGRNRKERNHQWRGRAALAKDAALV